VATIPPKIMAGNIGCIQWYLEVESLFDLSFKRPRESLVPFGS